LRAITTVAPSASFSSKLRIRVFWKNGVDKLKKETILFSIVMSALLVLAGLVGYIVGTLQGENGDDIVIPPPPKGLFDVVALECNFDWYDPSYGIPFCDADPISRRVAVVVTLLTTEAGYPIDLNIDWFLIKFEIQEYQGSWDEASKTDFKLIHNPEIAEILGGDFVKLGDVDFHPNALWLYLGESDTVIVEISLEDSGINDVDGKNIKLGDHFAYIVNLAGNDWEIDLIIDRVEVKSP